MRVFAATLGAMIVLLAVAAGSAAAQPPPSPQTALQRSLSQSMAQEGAFSGAEVVDMTTGQTLFAENPTTPRLPASVEKLYTTSTALLRLGPTATFSTSILGVGSRDPQGIWHGTLYLRGGGDPTFGAVGFVRSWYGTGATMNGLIRALLKTTGITGVQGGIVADGSYFDSRRGRRPPASRPTSRSRASLAGSPTTAGSPAPGARRCSGTPPCTPPNSWPADCAPGA